MKIILAIISILINCNLILAQINSSSARSLAMGNSNISISRGIDAIHSNPANLTFFNKQKWELSFIPRVAFELTNSSFDFGTYRNYFTADENGNPRYLDNIQKMDFLSLIEQNKPNEIYTSATIDIFNITATYQQSGSGFALSVRDRIFSNIDISKDVFDLVLFGNELNRKYDFSSTAGTGYWFREYTFGFGFQFYKSEKARLAFGINIKYLQGHAFYSVNCQDSEFTTTDSSLNGNIKINSTFSYINLFENLPYSILNNAGYGQAGDIGFGFTNQIISFGFAIKDIGYLNWYKNVYEININETCLIRDITDKNERKTYDDILNKNKNEIYTKQMYLPISIHAGLSLDIGKTKISIPFLFSLEYSLTLKNDILLNKDLSLFNLGLEFKLINWFPLRAGFVFGNISPRFSCGTGINTKYFDFDIGIGNIENIYFSNSSKSVSLAISTKFLF